MYVTTLRTGSSIADEAKSHRERRFGSLATGKDQAHEKPSSTNTPTTPTSQSTQQQIHTLMETNIMRSTTSSPDSSTSMDTFSDTSVATPNGHSSPTYPHSTHDVLKLPQIALRLLPREGDTRTDVVPSQKEESSSPQPKLVSSLSKPEDFLYDRYSRLIDSNQLDDIETAEIHYASYSPVEVATPISYLQPKSRPSMVSITIVPSKEATKIKETPRKISNPRPTLPERNPERSSSLSSKRLSTLSTKSGFLASEATPFQMPELPQNALTMISNASRDNLAEMKPQEAGQKLEKKSSMALLSKALKYSHSRISSRSQPTSPASTSRPQSQRNQGQSFPSMLSAERRYPFGQNPSEQSHTLPVLSRPQTAVPTARHTPMMMTALPECEGNYDIQGMNFSLRHSARQKSISALRSGSDSIGQALKMVKAKSRASIRIEPGSAITTAFGKANAPSSASPIGPSIPALQRPRTGSSAVSYSRPLRNSSLQPFGVTTT